jgi:hypothetical protein
MSTEIVTIEKQKTQLTDQEKGMIVARMTNAPIKELTKQTKLKGIADLIRGAYLTAGYNLKGSDSDEQAESVFLMAQGLSDAMEVRHPSYTLEDLTLAFKFGIFGDFGEYKGLSVVTFEGWVRAYDIKRRDAQFKYYKEQEKRAATELPEKTETEKERILTDATKKAFAEFRKCGRFNDVGNAIYNHLDKKGLLQFSAKEKRGFMIEAKEQLKNKNNPLFAKDSMQRSDLRVLISKIENKDKNTNALIIQEAKKQAINEHFKKITNLKKYKYGHYNHGSDASNKRGKFRAARVQRYHAAKRTKRNK